MKFNTQLKSLKFEICYKLMGVELINCLLHFLVIVIHDLIYFRWYLRICRICATVGVDANGQSSTCVCKGNMEEIFEVYVLGLQDYTIDSRGDAGAWYILHKL